MIPEIVFMRRLILRRLLPIGSGLLAVLGAASIADAHDFWLVPNAFAVAEGGTIEVRGQTSSKFPTSESAVSPDRLTDARVVGSGEDVRIAQVSTSGQSLVLRHRPSGPGQRIVAVSIAPRSVRSSGPGFKRYIELEGNPALAARYEREGLLPRTDSITRRYAKYAKTFVQVGNGGTPVFSRVIGQPLEFVPLTDPAALRAGDTLSLRLMYMGQPLAAHVHAGVSREGGDPLDLSADTDAQGIVRIAVQTPGLWNVRTLHVVPAPRGSSADWESHFATLVFSVRGGAPANADSAAVVDVTERYHTSLATGDSATALQLLASDAVILESGGAESRDEYRAHHLPADIAFAAIRAQRTVTRVVVRGDMAWVASTSTSQGEFRGRTINSAGAELMVLSRTGDGWRISAIHWSSRARRQ